MSTTTTLTKDETRSAAAVPGTIDTSQPRVPMHRLLAVEVRKLVDTRAGFWLVTLIVAANLLVTAALLVFADDEVLTFESFVGFATAPAGFLLPVLAILLVTSEWSQRSALITFGLEPRRGRVVVAKLLTGLVATAGTLLVALVFGVVGTLVATATHDLADPWQITAAGLTNVVLALLLSLLMAFAFGMALMSSPAAIVLYFVLPTVWTIIGSTVPWVRENLQEWADINAAQSPLLTSEWASGGEWLRLGVATAIWVLAPLAFGIWRLLRSEVK
jgi:ABC-type transport system involved in multi-copper enzyme maturation permease subunit